MEFDIKITDENEEYEYFKKLGFLNIEQDYKNLPVNSSRNEKVELLNELYIEKNDFLILKSFNLEREIKLYKLYQFFQKNPFKVILNLNFTSLSFLQNKISAEKLIKILNNLKYSEDSLQKFECLLNKIKINFEEKNFLIENNDVYNFLSKFEYHNNFAEFLKKIIEFTLNYINRTCFKINQNENNLFDYKLFDLFYRKNEYRLIIEILEVKYPNYIPLLDKFSHIQTIFLAINNYEQYPSSAKFWLHYKEIQSNLEYFKVKHGPVDVLYLLCLFDFTVEKSVKNNYNILQSLKEILEEKKKEYTNENEIFILKCLL